MTNSRRAVVAQRYAFHSRRGASTRPGHAPWTQPRLHVVEDGQMYSTGALNTARRRRTLTAGRRRRRRSVFVVLSRRRRRRRRLKYVLASPHICRIVLLFIGVR